MCAGPSQPSLPHSPNKLNCTCAWGRQAGWDDGEYGVEKCDQYGVEKAVLVFGGAAARIGWFRMYGWHNSMAAGPLEAQV